MPGSAPFVAAAPAIPGPVADTRRPRVKFPAGACDCHAPGIDTAPRLAERIKASGWHIQFLLNRMSRQAS
jgi:hypothetical protein